MAAPKLKVTYADGTEKVVKVTPRAQVMAEEKYGGDLGEAAKLRALYYVGWAALHKSGQEPDDFETWLDKIDDVEDHEDAPSDPTPAAPSAADS